MADKPTLRLGTSSFLVQTAENQALVDNARQSTTSPPAKPEAPATQKKPRKRAKKPAVNTPPAAPPSPPPPPPPPPKPSINARVTTVVPPTAPPTAAPPPAPPAAPQVNPEERVRQTLRGQQQTRAINEQIVDQDFAGKHQAYQDRAGGEGLKRGQRGWFYRHTAEPLGRVLGNAGMGQTAKKLDLTGRERPMQSTLIKGPQDTAVPNWMTRLRAAGERVGRAFGGPTSAPPGRGPAPLPKGYDPVVAQADEWRPRAKTIAQSLASGQPLPQTTRAMSPDQRRAVSREIRTLLAERAGKRVGTKQNFRAITPQAQEAAQGRRAEAVRQLNDPQTVQERLQRFGERQGLRAQDRVALTKIENAMNRAPTEMARQKLAAQKAALLKTSQIIPQGRSAATAVGDVAQKTTGTVRNVLGAALEGAARGMGLRGKGIPDAAAAVAGTAGEAATAAQDAFEAGRGPRAAPQGGTPGAGTPPPGAPPGAGTPPPGGPQPTGPVNPAGAPDGMAEAVPGQKSRWERGMDAIRRPSRLNPNVPTPNTGRLTRLAGKGLGAAGAVAMLPDIENDYYDLKRDPNYQNMSEMEVAGRVTDKQAKGMMGLRGSQLGVSDEAADQALMDSPWYMRPVIGLGGLMTNVGEMAANPVQTVKGLGQALGEGAGIAQRWMTGAPTVRAGEEELQRTSSYGLRDGKVVPTGLEPGAPNTMAPRVAPATTEPGAATPAAPQGDPLANPQQSPIPAPTPAEPEPRFNQGLRAATGVPGIDMVSKQGQEPLFTNQSDRSLGITTTPTGKPAGLKGGTVNYIPGGGVADMMVGPRSGTEPQYYQAALDAARRGETLPGVSAPGERGGSAYARLIKEASDKRDARANAKTQLEYAKLGQASTEANRKAAREEFDSVTKMLGSKEPTEVAMGRRMLFDMAASGATNNMARMGRATMMEELVKNAGWTWAGMFGPGRGPIQALLDWSGGKSPDAPGTMTFERFQMDDAGNITFIGPDGQPKNMGSYKTLPEELRGSFKMLMNRDKAAAAQGG